MSRLRLKCSTFCLCPSNSLNYLPGVEVLHFDPIFGPLRPSSETKIAQVKVRENTSVFESPSFLSRYDFSVIFLSPTRNLNLCRLYLGPKW